ncbi:molecular chaperone DnaK [Alicyclobacillus hesperidum subsp. aegles]|uniref:TraR/DksA C4-type zinc finger protein n=1 Tax=Alicyclobacillus hesperidum TaxID=89784 RepID=UPI00071945B2|nr:TraR/DksA C4-type zinc finger protein [Alicyclobacillus hesperidum]KRW92406.1 conjugal transfer protein TraR [Alicyclobacillus tengchongensis]GLG01091.1 molecular chaperone DnaK [Alicyclobacillus hesperidum subsp. aegles]
MKWEHMRQRLENQKREVEARLSVRNESADLGDSMRDEISELSMYDNHPADVASELFLRGMAVGDEVREEAYLEDLDEALKRIDAGTYGVCAECGREISAERMEAMPTARYCIECQEDAERRKKHRHRPVEEDVLWPGFGAVWLDDHDQTGFDGEDAYQAVARFQEPAFGEETYEQPDLDDNTGFVDPIDHISQEYYIRTLPSSAIELSDYDEDGTLA